MRRKVTKAAALLSAVLMASSSVPYGVLIPYNVLAEEVSADAGAAVQEETAATVGSVTNIKTWDAAGLLAAATTEDNGLSLKGDGWSAAQIISNSNRSIWNRRLCKGRRCKADTKQRCYSDRRLLFTVYSYRRMAS